MKHTVELATSGVVAFEAALERPPDPAVERWRRAAAAFRESGETSPTAQELIEAGDDLAKWLS